ncbi:MAG: hypothetical protein KC550_05710 [Nanoarchaeota archaeon]|nr:hypothetical protein [Nanoarchaeota archaeon]
MAIEEHSIHIILPAVVGFIIGIVEAYFVYEDENMTSGKDFLGDMWHGLIFSVLGVLAATNIPWIMAQVWFPEFLTNIMFVNELGISLVACILISLFMMVKMVASHAIKGVSGRGFSEKLWHKVLISVLIGFSPYYIFALMPVLEPLTSVFPDWMPF